MGYSKEIYIAANKVLEARRQKAAHDCEKRQATFYQRCPRAKEIKRLLASTAIQAARAVLRGANTKEELTLLKEKNLGFQQELRELLENAGLPETHLELQYSCSLCNDQGYIDGKMCSCMKNLLRQEAYNKLNELSPLSLSSFDTFSLEYYSTLPVRDNGPSPKKRLEDIFNYCKNYAESFSLSSANLLMQGATGLGKTHLSLSIATQAINKGYGVIYGSTQNIVTKLEKERFRYNKDSGDSDSERHLINCDLLILDDLGTEFSTSFSCAAIYNIINSRMLYEKPTIISTNLSLKELEKNYSERFVSRVMGNCVRLEFLGHDVRQQKRFKNRSH